MGERRARVAALTALAAAALVVGGCASDPPSPAQQRRDHVERRLDATFSRTQTRCIMEQLDAPTFTALDRSATLRPGSDELETYTNAVTACVLGLGG